MKQPIFLICLLPSEFTIDYPIERGIWRKFFNLKPIYEHQSSKST